MNKPTVASITLATIIEYSIYATLMYIVYKHVINKISERCLLMVDEDYICDASKNENEEQKEKAN